jgi:hypothetical protein
VLSAANVFALLCLLSLAFAAHPPCCIADHGQHTIDSRQLEATTPHSMAKMTALAEKPSRMLVTCRHKSRLHACLSVSSSNWRFKHHSHAVHLAWCHADLQVKPNTKHATMLKPLSNTTEVLQQFTSRFGCYTKETSPVWGASDRLLQRTGHAYRY